MKCKNCGGELIFKGDTTVCESCGAVSKIESAFDNTEVFICYIETDDSGRRTRDSIVAQEIYGKLEQNKITAFYERTSADGMTGDGLEVARHGAINAAKAIIAVGTTVENFNLIEEKFSKYFEGKKVIPFCVDVAPGLIPKTLSKIQAVSYSTIGWDKDLVKGIYVLLGRENEVDTLTLYGKKRKTITIIVSIVVIILLILSGALIWWFVSHSQKANPALGTPTPTMFTAATPTIEAQPEETVQPTEKPLSQNEIYNMASECFNQGDFADALLYFSQIPEHPDSANKIKLIYTKYEGYYSKDNFSLYLSIYDNIRAKIEISILSETKLVKISESGSLTKDSIIADYVDNHNNKGKIEIIFQNSGPLFKMIPTDGAETEILFLLSEKSDNPIQQIDAQMLNNWLKEQPTYDDFQYMGYRMSPLFDPYVGAKEEYLYEIGEEEVYLSFFRYYEHKKLDKPKLHGIAAPAAVIAPFLIGKEVEVVIKDDIVYYPNRFIVEHNDCDFFPFSMVGIETDSTAKEIKRDTLIGIASKKSMPQELWEELERMAKETAVTSSDSKTLPYIFKIESENHNIHTKPSYSSEIVRTIEKSSFTITEEQYDINGKLWGKLKSGLGWICLTDIQAGIVPTQTAKPTATPEPTEEPEISTEITEETENTEIQ